MKLLRAASIARVDRTRLERVHDALSASSRQRLIPDGPKPADTIHSQEDQADVRASRVGTL